MSQTPITDAQEFYESGNYDVDWPAEMRALELAANAMRDALKEMIRNGQKQSWNDNYPTSMGRSDAALAAFATLQPSPHDAPRT